MTALMPASISFRLEFPADCDESVYPDRFARQSKRSYMQMSRSARVDRNQTGDADEMDKLAGVPLRWFVGGNDGLNGDHPASSQVGAPADYFQVKAHRLPFAIICPIPELPPGGRTEAVVEVAAVVVVAVVAAAVEVAAVADADTGALDAADWRTWGAMTLGGYCLRDRGRLEAAIA